MMTTQTKFVQQITRAFEVSEETKQHQRQRQTLITEGEIQKELAFLGVTEAAIDGNFVEVGGVKLRATFYEGKIDGWQVHGECQECRKRCWSRYCHDLADIGEMYLEFIPNYNHRCSPSLRQTTEGRFLGVLSDLIDKKIGE